MFWHMAAGWQQTAATTIEKMAGDIVIAATTMHRQLQKGRLVDQAIFQIALPPARLEPLLFEQVKRDMVIISIGTAMVSDVNKPSRLLAGPHKLHERLAAMLDDADSPVLSSAWA